MKRCKRYIKNATLYEQSSYYSLQEAYSIYKKMKPSCFDESVDVSMILKLESKAQSIRSNVILPNGNGKKLRILLLTDEVDNNNKLKDIYNVDEVGGNTFIKNLLEKKIKLNYDYVITTPKMFPQLKPIARILGQRKLMPTIKNNTVTNDIIDAVHNIRKSHVNIKSNKNGIINVSIGRCSFNCQQICDNFKSLHTHIVRLKDSNRKNIQIKKIFVSTTMSPSIKIKLNKF